MTHLVITEAGLDQLRRYGIVTLGKDVVVEYVPNLTEEEAEELSKDWPPKPGACC